MVHVSEVLWLVLAVPPALVTVQALKAVEFLLWKTLCLILPRHVKLTLSPCTRATEVGPLYGRFHGIVVVAQKHGATATRRKEKSWRSTMLLSGVVRNA